GQLWITDSGRMDSNAPDELNRVQPGADFGWPHCVGADTDEQAMLRVQTPIPSPVNMGWGIVGSSPILEVPSRLAGRGFRGGVWPPTPAPPCPTSATPCWSPSTARATGQTSKAMRWR